MKGKHLKYLVLGSVLTVGFGASLTFAGIKAVSAQIASGKYPPIIQNLAKKFNVSEQDVQKVFDETRKQQEEARLDKLVTNGVITSEQKVQILAKREELQKKIDEINKKSLTAEQRHTEIQKLMESYKQWSIENKIPFNLLNLKRGGMRNGGMDRMERDGMRGFDKF